MHKKATVFYLPHISVNISIVRRVYVCISKFKWNMPEHWNENIYSVNLSLVCLWPMPAPWTRSQTHGGVTSQEALTQSF